MERLSEETLVRLHEVHGAWGIDFHIPPVLLEFGTQHHDWPVSLSIFRITPACVTILYLSCFASHPVNASRAQRTQTAFMMPGISVDRIAGDSNCPGRNDGAGEPQF